MPVWGMTPAHRGRHTFVKGANRVLKSIAATPVSCSVGKSDKIGQKCTPLLSKCIVTKFLKIFCGSKNFSNYKGECYVVDAGTQYFPNGGNNSVQCLRQSCFQVCFRWKWYSGVVFQSSHYREHDHLSRDFTLLSTTIGCTTNGAISGAGPSSHTAQGWRAWRGTRNAVCHTHWRFSCLTKLTVWSESDSLRIQPLDTSMHSSL